MLPTTSWPSAWNASNDSAVPGSSNGFATIIASAISRMTMTAELITNARENVASGPRARVCARMPSVADGLRLTARTPQRRATAQAAFHDMSRANGMKWRTARNAAAPSSKPSVEWIPVATRRLRSPLRS